LVSLDYFALSEEEVLDFALENKTRIVEVVVEDEYEDRGELLYLKNCKNKP